MRLWSIHPKYLDGKGLVALWRESLLAQKVLNGETKTYRHHPQLRRLRAHPDPKGAIAFFKYSLLLQESRDKLFIFVSEINNFNIS
ncbi:MAG: pyrimidine dimer DNA glycosylase/endonuclease V [Candidatus Methanoperedens sp.]|nr:pyrimidine dimer DNA glycosylase/endonuclease V [Candidatus Methanoperedens sp.]